MEKFTELTDEEMNTTSGGTYYGNGLYCDSNGCSVDWGKAWGCIANRAAGAYATGGQATIGNC